MSPEVYWRRRVIALAVGLSVLGLLTWAVGGLTGAHQTAADAALHDRGSPGSVSSNGSSPAPVSSPHPSPSPSPSPSRSHAASRPRHRAAARHDSPASRKGARGGTTRPAVTVGASGCPAADVVLTLTASGDRYGAGAQPGFTVDVVSTGARTCSFNVGSRYLTLVVESGGVREWGSGDCVRGSGSAVTRLQRGVPLQQHVTWDRLLSAPGCRQPRSTARPGTYTVTATDGSLRSRTLVFALS